MKKIVIIGGGLSGICAGIYALKNDFQVTIIEKNDEIGGLCTTWYMNDIMIDGCVHWITGSSMPFAHMNSSKSNGYISTICS